MDFGAGSDSSQKDEAARAFQPASLQNTSALQFGTTASRTDSPEGHPLIQHVIETLPQPLQPGSVTIHSAEFGTIRIHISQPSDALAGTGQRIQIRAVDPAARALLNDCIDHLRQKLQAESVHVFNPDSADRTPNPRGDRQQRRASTQAEPARRDEQRTDEEMAFWK